MTGSKTFRTNRSCSALGDHTTPLLNPLCRHGNTQLGPFETTKARGNNGAAQWHFGAFPSGARIGDKIPHLPAFLGVVVELVPRLVTSEA